MNHEVKMIASGGKHRVIYHAHTTNVIALTFVLPLKDEVFTRELLGNGNRVSGRISGRYRCRRLDGPGGKRYLP